jgi:type IV pilus assembly protein PilB
MATPGAQIQLSGLARKLVQDGIITDQQAQQANEASAKKKAPFVSYLVENDIASSHDIATAASVEFGVPLLDIDILDIENDVVNWSRKS